MPGTVYDLKKGKPVLMSVLLAQLNSYRVVFVGEAHDSDIDHAMQLGIIRQFHSNGKQIAVGLEMVPASFQPILDAWIAKKISEAEFSRMFSDVWSISYAYYEEIFNYARENNIPLVGLNITKKTFKKVSRDGVGMEPPDLLRKLKYSMCVQEFKYARAMRQYLVNLNHRQGNFNKMCDTQRFREAFMAWRIVDYLRSSEDTMIVLTGSAHAQKNAIPAMLRRHGEQNYAVLLPYNFSDILQANVTLREGDFVW